MSFGPVWTFDNPARFAYTPRVSTKRNVKPFSRNPKTKNQVLATKSSLRKTNLTFIAKPKALKKAGVAKLKPVRLVVPAPVVLPVPPQPTPPVNADTEQANKLAITLQLAKINDTLKAFKVSEREKCDRRIREAENKAITLRAEVYLKARKAGKFPATWTYPKEFLLETDMSTAK